ncbi:MAG: YraN family protein [Paludibacteraceae bacterium]|nr:YraN family protein [Paludibacteraceae bacterium]
MNFGHLHIRNRTGLFGEDTATNLLKQKGYRIIERNWKTGHLEIDIIAENKDTVAFVEVKTRSSLFNKRPEEYVDREKEQNMIVAANAYIKLTCNQKKPRFDIIGIIYQPITQAITYINHIENAFHPRLRSIGTNTYSGQRKWRAKSRKRGF